MSHTTVLFWIFLIGSGVHALTCFETNKDGEMIETTSDRFTYCVLSLERTEENAYFEGSAFGTGPKIDPTEAYNSIFDLSDNMYSILSMCIYERYDFGKAFPRFSFKEPEFMLRCFCNFDKCNREKNFFGYIKNLESDPKKAV